MIFCFIHVECLFRFKTEISRQQYNQSSNFNKYVLCYKYIFRIYFNLWLFFLKLDISSLTPKFNRINKYFNEKKESELILVNNRTKNLINVPKNEMFTSTPKFNGTAEGQL